MHLEHTELLRLSRMSSDELRIQIRKTYLQMRSRGEG